jgi:hypothetical protein
MSASDPTKPGEWEPKHALRRNRLSRLAGQQESVKVLLDRHGDSNGFPLRERNADTNPPAADGSQDPVAPPPDPWLRQPAATATRDRQAGSTLSNRPSTAEQGRVVAEG